MPKYEELIIEVLDYRHSFPIPRKEPILINAYLQANRGQDIKKVTTVHIVCPDEGDIVLTARPSGEVNIEPRND